MIFSEFTNKAQDYILSLRFVENYVSFDLRLPETWNIPTKSVKDIEVINTNKTSDGIRYLSLVCPNTKESVDKVEVALDEIIKFNKEKEEKERLFKMKVQELKSIFDKENIGNLRTLKIDIDEIGSIINGVEEKTEQNDERNTEQGEPVAVVQDGDVKRPKRNSKS